MTYTYVAVNDKNKKYKNEMAAETKEEVRRLLKERGLTALIIEEKKDAVTENSQKSIWQRDLNVKDIHEVKIPKKKILAMSQQMSIMMKAGLNLSKAMEILIETEKHKQLKEILELVNKDLYNGVTLSVAMSKFVAFPPLLVNIVQAGEANGRLDTSFEQVALILEKELNLTGKVKSALIYPCVLIVATIAVVIIISTVVVPQFKAVFESFDQELPAVSQFVFTASDLFLAYWYIFVAVLAIVVISIRFAFMKNDNLAMWWAEKKMFLPVIGDVIRITYMARFCRMLSTMTDAGVSILRALELSRDVVSNIYLKDCLNQVIEDVKIGTPINVSMSRYPIFDSLIVSLLKAAEESGQLSEALKRISDTYEERANESTKRLTELMTPIIIIIMAVVVGGIVISVVVPMFQIYDMVLAET